MNFDFGLHFESVADRVKNEREERLANAKRLLPYGITFLDDALGGILPHDLVVLGARTGSGKTSLATIIAQENVRRGKRVHFFALEADPREIERRMKYRFVYDLARLKDHEKERMSYRSWVLGRVDDLTAAIEPQAEERFAELRGLHTYYRGALFTVGEMDKLFRAIRDQCDLIVLDHLHYIDSPDETNELRAQKEITKRIRDLAISLGVPVLVVAHLRKRDRASLGEVVPDLEEFMGSSDIAKIATSCIMLAAAPRPEGAITWGTYVHIAKDRLDGRNHYIGKVFWNPRRNAYEPEYRIGRIDIATSAWNEITANWPRWAQNAVRTCE
jgi:hypothetical protein